MTSALCSSATAQSPAALTITPQSVIGGSTAAGLVTLTAAAPVGGTTVTLTSSNTSAATVPASTTVAAGATTVTFTVSTSAVTTTKQVTVSATSSSVTKTAVLYVNPTASNSQNPQVTAGASAIFAPSIQSVISATWAIYDPSGTMVAGLGTGTPGTNLWDVQWAMGQDPSTNASIVAAIQVTAPAGAQPLAGYKVAVNGPGNNASYFDVIPGPPVSLTTFGLSSSSVVGGTSVTGTVTIDNPAQYGGATINLTNSNTSAATVPSSVIIPANSTSGTFTITTPSVTTLALTTIAAICNGITVDRQLATTPTGGSLTVQSITLNPATVTATNTSTGVVTLGAAAPAGGAVVTLSSSNTAAATVPASVTVPVGQTSASFTVTSKTVSSATTVNITGSYNSSSQAAPLTVTPATTVALTLVTVSPNLITGGTSTTGTVLLSAPAPSGGKTVTLSSSNTSALTVPTSVVVPQGSSNANFIISTPWVSSSSTVTVSAVLSGVTKTATVTVNPTPSATLTDLTLTPSTVIGALTNGTNSTGTVTISTPAGSAGVVVTLTSSLPSTVAVPSTVTIPAGLKSTTFSATTSNVTTQTTVTISAIYGSIKISKDLTINPWLDTLTLSPSPVVGGNPSTATLHINAPAPTGGLPVQVSVASGPNAGDASIPDGGNVSGGILTVPSGSQTATFQINTIAVVGSPTVDIKATCSGLTKTATLSLQQMLGSLSLTPGTVTGGASSQGRVTLNGPAPAGGTSVVIGSNSGLATASSPLVIAPGATSGTFPISTSIVTSVSTAQISASLAGATTSQTLTLNPVAVTLSLSSSTAVSGTPVTGTININTPAPTGGLVVNLSSGNTSAATVPATVTVPDGLQTITFPIATLSVPADRTFNITASYGGLSSLASLTVKPLLKSVSISPSSVVEGATALGTVTLNAPAPTAGTVVTLTSSNTASATVPASVTVGSGNLTATFTVTTLKFSGTPVTITAANDIASTTTTISIQPLLASLTLTPTSVTWGNSSMAQITLNAPAPSNITFTLASNNPKATVPGPVTISAGNSTMTFTVSTSEVPSTQTAQITATCTVGSTQESQSATLTIIQLLSSVSLTSTNIFTGSSTTGTITLSQAAPAGGISIGLSSTTAGIVSFTPATSVTVPAGAASVGFTVTGLTSGSTSVKATYGTTSVTRFLTVSDMLSSLSATPSSIVAGDGTTLRFNYSMTTPSGRSLTLSSSNSAVLPITSTLAVTPSVTFQTLNLTSVAGSVTGPTPVTINAYDGYVNKMTIVTVYPAPALTSVTVVPNEVYGGVNTTGTVQLSNIAPATGAVVSLATDNTAYTSLPTTVTVPSGSNHASFTINTTPTVDNVTAQISATYAGVTQSAPLTVDRPLLSSVTFSPSTFPGGNATTGTLTLASKAPASGLTVDLTISPATSGTFPQSTPVIISPNQTLATFQVATSTVNSPTTVTVTATHRVTGGESITGTINLTPYHLHATDILMPQGSSPRGIQLAWSAPSTSGYDLKRDGSTVYTSAAGSTANMDATGTTTIIDNFNWVSGQTYRYDLYDRTSPTETLLSTEQTVPYLVPAIQNQTIDNRLDPRFSSTTNLNHKFGSSTYKGGLFVGYAADPSQKGRSYAEFTLNAAPSNGVFRTGKVNAALTTAYIDSGSVSNLLIGCQNIGTNAWSAPSLTWDTAPVFTPSAATQTITVNYNGDGTPTTNQWYSWRFESDILAAVQGSGSAKSLSFGWASMNEARYGWAYFAKTEFNPLLGPNATDLWSIPTLVRLTVPSPVSVTGSATGQVFVNGIGLQGSAVVTLTSSNTAVATVPSSITVTGLNTTFVVSLKTTGSTTITASYGGITQSVPITVTN